MRQPHQQRDEARGERRRQHARQHALRRVGHVGQAGADGTAHGGQAGRVAEQGVDTEVHRRHAQRDAQAVQMRGFEPLEERSHLTNSSITRRSLAGNSCTDTQADLSAR